MRHICIMYKIKTNIAKTVEESYKLISMKFKHTDWSQH